MHRTKPRRVRQRDWIKLFRSADKDGNGTLDINELRELFQRDGSNTSETQLRAMFQYFDGPKGDMQITLKEFLAGIERLNQFQKKVEAQFKKFDENNSGYLDRDEMRKLILSSGHNFTPAEIEELIKRADTNGDGQISLDELRHALS